MEVEKRRAKTQTCEEGGGGGAEEAEDGVLGSLSLLDLSISLLAIIAVTNL